MVHDGIWGHAPRITSLANTDEVLYRVNRPSNCLASDYATEWVHRAIALTRPSSSNRSDRRGVVDLNQLLDTIFDVVLFPRYLISVSAHGAA
jgi:hypothetical protein